MNSFRLSEARDVPQILAIITQAQAYLAAQGIDQWQNGYPDEAVIKSDIARGVGYVLDRDGVVRGIAAIVFDGEPSYRAIHDGAWTTPEPYACIHRIALDASFRGTGLADALMAEADRVIRARGITSVRIDTHPDNQVMQRMLARNGYQRCGVIYIEGSTEHGAARVALEKSLQIG